LAPISSFLRSFVSDISRHPPAAGGIDCVGVGFSRGVYPGSG